MRLCGGAANSEDLSVTSGYLRVIPPVRRLLYSALSQSRANPFRLAHDLGRCAGGSLAISFPIFVLGSYIIPCGLAFLETACNPYILAMGPRETATQRLNLAQAFNPIGSLTGMAIATFILAPQLEINKFTEDLGKNDPSATKFIFTPDSALPEGARIEGENVILSKDVIVPLYDEIPIFSEELPGVLSGATSDALKGINATQPEEFKKLQAADLANVRTPYLVIAIIVFLFFLLFAFLAFPLKTQKKKLPSLRSPFVSFVEVILPAAWSRKHFTSEPRSCAGPTSFTTAWKKWGWV